MSLNEHRKSVAFIALGVCLVALAITLNVGWIVLNWRAGVLLVLGVLFFTVIISGVVVNTIVLVREIRKNQQHDAFINAVTHELKTPVASIRLYLETLQSREVDEATRRDFYDLMLADSDRLRGMIDQVLRAGSARGRRLAAARVPVDLRAILQECIAKARTSHRLEPDAVAYAEHVPGGGGVTIMGDLDELRAAVSNLLDNAIRYSVDQVKVLVELARVDADRVVVRVTDQGVGIASKELKRIFRRFYRVPGAVHGRVNGTGLGLYIVQSVARRHGGRVFAESEGEGRGSRMTLQLPCPAE